MVATNTLARWSKEPRVDTGDENTGESTDTRNPSSGEALVKVEETLENKYDFESSRTERFDKETKDIYEFLSKAMKKCHC